MTDVSDLQQLENQPTKGFSDVKWIIDFLQNIFSDKNRSEKTFSRGLILKKTETSIDFYI